MQKSVIKDFRDLRVWQESMELSKAVYKITAKFPEEEKFSLTSQIRRSAISVPSNIAEGEGRDSLKDYLKHLSIANGSLSELRTQIIISKDLGFMSLDLYNRFDKKVSEIAGMLKKMQNNLKKKL